MNRPEHRGVRRLLSPVVADEISALRAGDIVRLDGEIVITAGLPTHQRLMRCVEGQESLPFSLSGATLLHFGGMSEIDGPQPILHYINPTTSTRFNPYMPRLIEGFGLHVVGGKGGLDTDCAAAMARAGCVYLSFIGGGCTLFSQAIREVVEIGWRDMLTHYRLLKLRVEGLGPAIVAIDAHGSSVYAQAELKARAILAGWRAT